MAMPDIWGFWNNSINRDSVNDAAKKLKHFGRQNLIAVAATCAIGGSLSAVVGLAGNYSPKASYCDTRTKPCTKVEVSALTEIPLGAKDLKFTPGTGLQRTAASVISVLFFGGGLAAIALAEENQEDIEPQLQADKQVALARIELEATEELQNLANLSQISVETHKQELLEAQAELMLERNPHLVDQYAPKVIEPATQPEAVEQSPQLHVAATETEITKPDPVKETWEFIRNWEGGWIVDLLECPVLVWGSQGSFKSYFSAYLALLRHFLKGHKLKVADPHLELNKNKCWKELLAMGVSAVGRHNNYAAIAEVAQEVLDRMQFATDGKGWWTVVFDEVSNYAFEPDIADISATLVRRCLTDTRKAAESPIFIAHNNTQEIAGGVKGVRKLMDEGLCQLQLFSKRKDGEYYPLFKGRLTGFRNEQGEPEDKAITIDPQIMHPAYLIKLFNAEVEKPKEQSLPDEPEQSVTIDSASGSDIGASDPLPSDLIKLAVERLEQSLNLSPPQDEDSQLSATIRDITQQLSPLPAKEVLFEWTVTKISEFYPNHTPQTLFGEIAAALKTGAKVRDVITNILKCKGGRTHKTRSYTVHGKTLMLWLLTTYGDESLMQLPKVKKFLESEQ